MSGSRPFCRFLTLFALSFLLLHSPPLQTLRAIPLRPSLSHSPSLPLPTSYYSPKSSTRTRVSCNNVEFADRLRRRERKDRERDRLAFAEKKKAFAPSVVFLRYRNYDANFLSLVSSSLYCFSGAVYGAQHTCDNPASRPVRLRLPSPPVSRPTVPRVRLRISLTSAFSGP